MNRDEYNKAIDRIQEGWASDRIEREPMKTILTCENGTFIKIALMELPEDAPPQMKEQMHNKLLIQWTDDLNKDYYKNIARYIAKEEFPSEGPMCEAVKELVLRAQMAEFLR